MQPSLAVLHLAALMLVALVACVVLGVRQVPKDPAVLARLKAENQRISAMPIGEERTRAHRALVVVSGISYPPIRVAAFCLTWTVPTFALAALLWLVGL